MRAHLLALLAVTALGGALLAGCDRPPEGEQVVGQPSELVDQVPDDPALEEEWTAVEGTRAWTLTSTAFESGATIPTKYTEDGEDVSPPLTFADLPPDTEELALICHDPDAPREGGWTHWVVYGMDSGLQGLPEAVPAEERVEEPALIQGENSWGKIGYGGPAPPPGSPHRYQFTLYALSERLNLEPGATKDELEAAMEGKIIDQAMLEGLYGR